MLLATAERNHTATEIQRISAFAHGNLRRVGILYSLQIRRRASERLAQGGNLCVLVLETPAHGPYLLLMDERLVALHVHHHVGVSANPLHRLLNAVGAALVVG